MAWREHVDVEFACAYVPAVAVLMKKHGFVYEASNILESIKRYKATEATITINRVWLLCSGLTCLHLNHDVRYGWCLLNSSTFQ